MTKDEQESLKNQVNFLKERFNDYLDRFYLEVKRFNKPSDEKDYNEYERKVVDEFNAVQDYMNNLWAIYDDLPLSDKKNVIERAINYICARIGCVQEYNRAIAMIRASNQEASADREEKYGSWSWSNAYNGSEYYWSWYNDYDDLFKGYRQAYGPHYGYYRYYRYEHQNSYQEYNQQQYNSYNDYNQSKYFKDCKSKDDVKKTFRKLAKKYHPDSPDGNEKIFVEIQQEYQIMLKRF